MHLLANRVCYKSQEDELDDWLDGITPETCSIVLQVLSLIMGRKVDKGRVTVAWRSPVCIAGTRYVLTRSLLGFMYHCGYMYYIRLRFHVHVQCIWPLEGIAVGELCILANKTLRSLKTAKLVVDIQTGISINSKRWFWPRGRWAASGRVVFAKQRQAWIQQVLWAQVSLRKKCTYARMYVHKNKFSRFCSRRFRLFLHSPMLLT